MELIMCIIKLLEKLKPVLEQNADSFTHNFVTLELPICLHSQT